MRRYWLLGLLPLMACGIGLSANYTRSPFKLQQIRRTAPSHIEDNQRLLRAIDDELEEGNESIRKLTASLEAELTIKSASELTPENASEIKNMIRTASTFKGGMNAVDQFSEQSYWDALYSLLSIGAKFVGGPASWAAFGTNTIVKAIELQLIARDQARLAAIRWKLLSATQYARFKDPKNQAELKRILDRLQGELDEWDKSFRRGLYGSDETAESLTQKLAEQRDKAAARKAIHGLQIVDHIQNIEALKSNPCINPAFIRALEEENRLLAQNKLYEAMQANKDSDGYIPAFQAKCNQAGGTGGEQRTSESETDKSGRFGLIYFRNSGTVPFGPIIDGEPYCSDGSGRGVKMHIESGQTVRPGETLVFDAGGCNFYKSEAELTVTAQYWDGRKWVKISKQITVQEGRNDITF